jgi:hypothetical protein
VFLLNKKVFLFIYRDNSETIVQNAPKTYAENCMRRPVWIKTDKRTPCEQRSDFASVVKRIIIGSKKTHLYPLQEMLTVVSIQLPHAPVHRVTRCHINSKIFGFV